MNKQRGLVVIFVLGIGSLCYAQQETNKKIHLTTGIGVNKIQGSLGRVFRSTIAFNSGFEKEFSHNWFGQLEANFNTLKYDQQVKDENSNFLFQNTSSSLFMVGLNGGKNFPFGRSNWFGSLYLGAGYINIGEPRLALDEQNNVITQDITRKGGVLGKSGGRIGINTRSKILHTIFLDGSYWISSLRTQGHQLNSISIFLGMRMAMN